MYSWMVVLHGDWPRDWHTLQLLAEVIRLQTNLLSVWLQTQWQEIQLLGLYQTLLHKAMLVFNTTRDANVGDQKRSFGPGYQRWPQTPCGMKSGSYSSFSQWLYSIVVATRSGNLVLMISAIQACFLHTATINMRS